MLNVVFSDEREMRFSRPAKKLGSPNKDDLAIAAAAAALSGAGCRCPREEKYTAVGKRGGKRDRDRGAAAYIKEI